MSRVVRKRPQIGQMAPCLMRWESDRKGGGGFGFSLLFGQSREKGARGRRAVLVGQSQRAHGNVCLYSTISSAIIPPPWSCQPRTVPRTYFLPMPASVFFFLYNTLCIVTAHFFAPLSREHVHQCGAIYGLEQFSGNAESKRF